ncbi:carboxypeptidase-like regulatory domain-containing protein [Flavobacterium hauense]
MKKFTLLLLLLPFMALAQTITITGTLKDATTNEPVEMASIGTLESNISVISNETGDFRITVPSATKSIYFSHLSYKAASLALSGKDETVTLKLEQNQILLEETVITNKPIKEILKEAVSASKKRLEKSLVLNTYYREFAKVNSHYLKFADGLLDYNVKRKSGAADLYVQQSRAKQLVDNNTQIFKKMKNGDTESNTDIVGAMNIYDVKEAVADASNFKIVNKLLDADNYNYELKLRKNSDGKDIEIIKVIPKPEVHEILYEGQVVYEADTKLILEIDVRTAESHKQYADLINVLFFKFKLLNLGKKVVFKNTNNKYILSYSQNRLSVYVTNKNKFDDTFDFMSDVVTIDYKEGEFEFDKNKRYKKKDLFSAGNNFTTEYWKTSNMLLLTAGEENVLKSFE